MLVITALVGTRDLGQEVYVALTKADVGKGLVAGACIAMIAMIADRHDDARRAPAAAPPRPRAVTDPLETARAPRRERCRSGRGRSSPQPLAGGITNLNFVVEDAGAAVPGADRRRHSRAQHPALRRARRKPRRPCRRASRRRCAMPSRARWCSTSSRAARSAAEDVRDPANLDAAGRAGAALPSRDRRGISAGRRRCSGCSRCCATTATACARSAARIAADLPRLLDAAERLEAAVGAGRDRVRPQRPAAREHPRRRRAALAGGLGIRRLQQSAVRPRRPRLQRRHGRGRERGAAGRPISGARRTRICGAASRR